MSEFDNTKDNEIIETNDDFENDEFVKIKLHLLRDIRQHLIQRMPPLMITPMFSIKILP